MVSAVAGKTPERSAAVISAKVRPVGRNGVVARSARRQSGRIVELSKSFRDRRRLTLQFERSQGSHAELIVMAVTVKRSLDHFMEIAGIARASRSAIGETRKTACGVPAAAQTVSKASRSRSIHVESGVAWPKGGIPPIANPVAVRTKAALGRSIASPTASATWASLTRLAPETRKSNGRPLSTPLKTRDLTISPTEQPQATAASSAVRVELGIVWIVTDKPKDLAASRTRRAGPVISFIPGLFNLACTAASWLMRDRAEFDKRL